MLILLFPVVALLLTMLYAYRSRLKEPRYLYALALSVLYSTVLYLSSGISPGIALFIAGIAVIGVDLIYSYSSHRVDFALGAAFLVISFLYWSALPQNSMPFIEAFAIGSLLALLLRFGYIQKVNRNDKKLERKRDLFQVLIGVIAIASFLLLPEYAYAIVFLLSFFGYAVSGLLINHKAAGFLRSMERKNSVLGAGAIYMAIGTMLILGSTPNRNFAAVGLIALLLCDAIATIFGIHGKHRLPYNKNKTLEGTVAYFVVLALAGSMFIGYYSLLFATVLALLESVPISVDDNISVPIMAILLYRLILL